MIKIHLSELLKEQHMTQAELAKNTGIRLSAICNAENFQHPNENALQMQTALHRLRM